MNAPDVQTLLFGTLLGVVVASVAVLGLLIGVCVLFGFPKLRASGPRTRVVRSLDEAVGQPEAYFGPEVPRGTIDQLRTPELLELAARKTS
jgi:hypothetical protein